MVFNEFKLIVCSFASCCGIAGKQVSVGSSVPSGCSRWFTKRIYRPIHDERMGYVCCGIFGYLHCQPRSFHDHSVVGDKIFIASCISFAFSSLSNALSLHLICKFFPFYGYSCIPSKPCCWMGNGWNFSEEFHEFTGLDDTRLKKPYSHKPSFKFGTTTYSHTDSTIAKYFPDMHSYMSQ